MTERDLQPPIDPVSTPPTLHQVEKTIQNLLDGTPEHSAQGIAMMRALVEELYMFDPESLDGFWGIKVVEKAGDRPKGEDCAGYIFGVDADVHKETNNILENWQFSTKPVPGGVIFYANSDLKILHIGTVKDEQTVISKWGIGGNVYEHHPLLIPNFYGQDILFYHPSEKED